MMQNKNRWSGDENRYPDQPLLVHIRFRSCAPGDFRHAQYAGTFL
jgi:hypothetical protein